ncbi:uncharacterized protein [Halyomorpha halys]|uniref:uncharacterized protein n=1 Tax=Halyomorpha halys TaxID=286706 RepID=UPI0034D271A3
MLHFILTSDPKRAFKKSEYVVIHPNISWDIDVTREQIINDHFQYFRKLALEICEFCIPTVQILLIGSRCMVPFRLILALFLNELPLSQVHAVSRIVERAAASVISHRAECNSNEIQGVAVFGEDIVEVKNSWLEWSPACDADLIDRNTVKYGDPELGQWIEKREELREAMARLELPKGVEVVGLDPLNPNLDDGLDLPPLEVPKVNIDALIESAAFEDEFLPGKEEGGFEELEAEMKTHHLQGEEHRPVSEETEERLSQEVTTEQSDHKQMDQKGEAVDWREWMKERFPDIDHEPKKKTKSFWEDFYKEGRTSATRFRESSKPWQCPLYPKPLDVPQDSKKEDGVNKLCSDWRRRVETIIKDEKFLIGTICEKCRHSLTGYAQAKGVINYIRKVLMSKKCVYTNEVVCSPGVYGIPEGIYSSFPVRVDANKNCKIIQGYQLSEMTLIRIRRMVNDVLDDYEQVFKLFHYNPPQKVKDQWQMRGEYEQLPEEPMEYIPEELQDELKEEVQEEMQEKD